jgi:hypothetical protein
MTLKVVAIEDLVPAGELRLVGIVRRLDDALQVRIDHGPPFADYFVGQRNPVLGAVANSRQQRGCQFAPLFSQRPYKSFLVVTALRRTLPAQLAVRDENLAAWLTSNPIFGSGRAIAVRAPTTLQRLWPVVGDDEVTPEMRG